MPNWAGGASGAAGGAIAGAGIGGGWGAIPGAIAGGAAGLFSGNKDRQKPINRLTPEQQQLLQNYSQQIRGMQGPGGQYDQAQQYNQRMLSGDPAAYQQWAAPYRQEFEQETIPMLSERFAGIGGGLGGGVMGSSGFGQAIGGAGAKFESNLAHLYATIQNQAADRAFNQYNLLGQNVLGTQGFYPSYQQGDTGFGGAALTGAMEGLFKQGGQETFKKFGDWMAEKKQSTGTQGQAGTGTTFDYKKK